MGCINITCIYSIYFPADTELVTGYYIGCTTNLNKRSKEHLQKLKNGTHENRLLRSAYTIYGIPIIEVLEQCTTEILLNRERYWINLFDSYFNGFNLTIGGQLSGMGAYHPSAMYSKDIYIRILHELAVSNKTAKCISKELNVSDSVVKDISMGSTHGWLAQESPIDYAIVQDKQGKRPSGSSSANLQGKVYPNILSPKNVVYKVENITHFALSNNLDKAALHRLLTFRANSHLGWKRTADYV